MVPFQRKPARIGADKSGQLPGIFYHNSLMEMVRHGAKGQYPDAHFPGRGTVEGKEYQVVAGIVKQKYPAQGSLDYVVYRSGNYHSRLHTNRY